jgi:hypothetical protein
MNQQWIQSELSKNPRYPWAVPLSSLSVPRGGAGGADWRQGEIGENAWGQRSRPLKVRFAGPATTSTPWTKSNRVFVCQATLSIGSTSYSKVRPDSVIIPLPAQLVNL